MKFFLEDLNFSHYLHTPRAYTKSAPWLLDFQNPTNTTTTFIHILLNT